MKKKYRSLTPIIILLLLCILTIAYAILLSFNLEDYFLSIEHGVALILVLISFISYFLYKPSYKYFLALTLLLGLINIINFTPLDTISNSYLHGFNQTLNISFQPITFIIIIITYKLNRERINEIIRQLFSKIGENIIKETKPVPEQVMKIAEVRRNEMIENYKEKYRRFTNEELDKIILDTKYVPEAHEAARQLRSGINDPNENQTKSL